MKAYKKSLTPPCTLPLMEHPTQMYCGRAALLRQIVYLYVTSCAGSGSRTTSNLGSRCSQSAAPVDVMSTGTRRSFTREEEQRSVKGQDGDLVFLLSSSSS